MSFTGPTRTTVNAEPDRVVIRQEQIYHRQDGDLIRPTISLFAGLAIVTILVISLVTYDPTRPCRGTCTPPTIQLIGGVVEFFVALLLIAGGGYLLLKRRAGMFRKRITLMVGPHRLRGRASIWLGRGKMDVRWDQLKTVGINYDAGERLIVEMYPRQPRERSEPRKPVQRLSFTDGEAVDKIFTELVRIIPAPPLSRPKRT